MNPNFPHNLAIHASNPKSALRYLVASNNSALDWEYPVSDEEILMSAQNRDIKSYGIAGRIWEASYAMSIFIDPPVSLEFEPLCTISQCHGAVVELGAGTGFLGFKLARILSLQQLSFPAPSKRLILTDLASVCPLLEQNRQKVGLRTNLPGVDLVIRPLEWGNMAHGYRLAAERNPKGVSVSGDDLLSHIVCSDVVYFPELFAPLLRTLLQLSSAPFSTAVQPVQIIISYMIRSLSQEAPFWSAFGRWFDFSPVLVRHKSAFHPYWERFGSHEEGTMFIFVATRKPAFFSETVPDDMTLMAGVDDTFETLLLMNVSNCYM